MTLTVTTRFRMRPPWLASAVITSGTPCPLASGANLVTSGPTSSPPSAGRRTRLAGPKTPSHPATSERANTEIDLSRKMNPTDPNPVVTPTTSARMIR